MEFLMAVGDIINGVFATTAAYQYFQPAVSVEIVLFWAGGMVLAYAGLNNGVSNAVMEVTDSTNQAIGANLKLGITNTNYLSVYGSTSPPCYSGIQIK